VGTIPQARSQAYFTRVSVHRPTQRPHQALARFIVSPVAAKARYNAARARIYLASCAAGNAIYGHYKEKREPRGRIPLAM
jgi:hypothetical protein